MPTGLLGIAVVLFGLFRIRTRTAYKILVTVSGIWYVIFVVMVSFINAT